MKYYKIALIFSYLIFTFLLCGCELSPQQTNSNDSQLNISEHYELNSTNQYTCNKNSDCVPNKCCHAKGCINIKLKPNCGNTFCTLNYESDDVTSKNCVCVNKKCETNISSH